MLNNVGWWLGGTQLLTFELELIRMSRDVSPLLQLADIQGTGGARRSGWWLSGGRGTVHSQIKYPV